MEGPSLVILREELEPFLGHKVIRVSGNTREPKESLLHRKLDLADTWGKTLFLRFTDRTKTPRSIITRTHFLLFGSYRINEPKADRSPRLELEFENGTIYFYNGSFRMGAEEIYASLDRRVDVLSKSWDENHVLRLMRLKRTACLCDLFLDQSIFAGSGNIVKNEVLFNLRAHPLLKLSEIPEKEWPTLVRAVRSYCKNFYKWKKRFELRRHWQVYRKGRCPLCDTKLIRGKIGVLDRMNFHCPSCQARRSRQRKYTLHPVLAMKKAKSPLQDRIDH